MNQFGQIFNFDQLKQMENLELIDGDDVLAKGGAKLVQKGKFVAYNKVALFKNFKKKEQERIMQIMQTAVANKDVTAFTLAKLKRYLCLMRTLISKCRA